MAAASSFLSSFPSDLSLSHRFLSPLSVSAARDGEEWLEVNFRRRDGDGKGFWWSAMWIRPSLSPICLSLSPISSSSPFTSEAENWEGFSGEYGGGVVVLTVGVDRSGDGEQESGGGVSKSGENGGGQAGQRSVNDWSTEVGERQ